MESLVHCEHGPKPISAALVPPVTPHVCQFKPAPGVFALPQVHWADGKCSYTGVVFTVAVQLCDCGAVKLFNDKNNLN
jgi:hypothetical protein